MRKRKGHVAMVGSAWWGICAQWLRRIGRNGIGDVQVGDVAVAVFRFGGRGMGGRRA